MTKQKVQMVEKANPFFSVEREPLKRNDGVDVKVDALYRKDDKSQLAVVSRDYRLVSHREVVDFALGLLKKQGLEHTETKYGLSANGAVMRMYVEFPRYRFNPAADTGIDNTALDGKPKLDDIIPSLVSRNSYNKQTSIDFDGGAKRLVCLNGMTVPVARKVIKIAHYGKFQLEDYAQDFVEQIGMVVSGIKQFYIRANTESGTNYIKDIFLKEMFAKKYLLELQSMLGSERVHIEWERDEENHKRPIGVDVRQELSAWAVYALLTNLATHRVRSPQVRSRMQQGIAQMFAV